MLLFPNAKINLGLSIVERRPDNFHNINSIFYPIPMKDAVEAVVDTNLGRGEIQFTSSGLNIPGHTDSNLCVKAYQMLHDTNPLPGVKAHLHKLIPMGAGLGGGSSDAAFFIHILDEICQIGLSMEQKLEFAARLGSDCSFFIQNKPAFCYSRGELFEPVSLNLTGYWLVLVYPPIHIGTKEAYAGVIPQKAKFDLKSLEKLPVEEWKEVVINDFEASIFPQYPLLKELKEELYNLEASYASMSGSGSTVFGLFKKSISLQGLEKYGQVWSFSL
jgi:4-diphosphocytidyl-2-C-methyl-D-erythritol kinase